MDGASFGPDALRTIWQAFDAAWSEIAGNFGDDPTELDDARYRLATALLSVVGEDRHDVESSSGPPCNAWRLIIVDETRVSAISLHAISRIRHTAPLTNERVRHLRRVAGAELPRAATFGGHGPGNPNASSPVLNVARLLESAEEAQTQAQSMMLPRTRLQMLKLAKIYRHMAEIALQYPTISDKDQVDLSD